MSHRMTDKQNQIKQSVTDCLKTLDLKFGTLKKDLCDELTQSILGQLACVAKSADQKQSVFDQEKRKLTEYNQEIRKLMEYSQEKETLMEYDHATILMEYVHATIRINAIDAMNRQLKKGEYYVYESYTINRKIEGGYEKKYYLLCSITNFSNLSWLTFSIQKNKDNDPILSRESFELNFPLHNIFIDILSILKNAYSPTVVHELEIDFIDQWVKTLQQIIELNKKYYVNLLISEPENDLRKMCEVVMDDNKRLCDENEGLKEEIRRLTQEKDLQLQCHV